MEPPELKEKSDGVDSLGTGAETDQQAAIPVKPSATKSPRKKLILGLLLITLLLIAGIVSFLLFKPDSPATQLENASQNNQGTQSQPKYRLVYALQTGAEEDPGKRLYPVYELWYEDTGAKPIKIGNFGSKFNYLGIYDSKLTPDNKYILLDYETRLDLAEIPSGKVTTIWKAQNDFGSYGTIFNSEGSQLLVFSAKLPGVPGDDSITNVERINLSDLKTERVYSGDQQIPLAPQAWRSDNKVVVNMIPFSEFVGRGVLDLTTGSFIAQERVERAYTSTNGMTVALPANHIDDLCNGFSGSSISGYEIKDPVSGVLKRHLNAPANTAISELEFNRQGTHILVKTFKIQAVTDPGDPKCQESYYDSNASYFLADVSGGELTPIVSREEAFKKWYPEEPYAEATRSGDTCTLKLFAGNSLSTNCNNKDGYRVIGVQKL